MIRLLSPAIFGEQKLHHVYMFSLFGDCCNLRSRVPQPAGVQLINSFAHQCVFVAAGGMEEETGAQAK